MRKRTEKKTPGTLAVEKRRPFMNIWRESAPVHEVFRQSEVEVFDLTGHPKARRAYGWSHPENADSTGTVSYTHLTLPTILLV